MRVIAADCFKRKVRADAAKITNAICKMTRDMVTEIEGFIKRDDSYDEKFSIRTADSLGICLHLVTDHYGNVMNYELPIIINKYF